MLAEYSMGLILGYQLLFSHCYNSGKDFYLRSKSKGLYWNFMILGYN